MQHLSILHLVNGISDSSITRIVRDLVHHLGQQNFTWHVGGLSGMGDMEDEFERIGAKVVVFAKAKGRPVDTMRRIRDYVAGNRIDIVHTHTPRAILMLRLALGRRRHQQLHLATKHILNFPGDRKWGLLYSLVDRLLLYSPDHLIAVSGRVYREITVCPGLDSRRVSMIRNAVDASPYNVPDQRDSCRAEFGLPPESLVIGSTGRVEKQKRYDLFIRGFSSVLSRHPQARLMIVGDGTLRKELEQLAVAEGLSHAVIWPGFRSDIPRLLAAMDIYVQSSANEGLSLSILEAMAAGKPVIITDVGGARELVEDGKTGLLIPPGSASVIAESILALMGNPARMSEIARAGREYVVQEFGLMRMMESYCGLYRTLAKRLP